MITRADVSLELSNWDYDEEAGTLMRHDSIRDIFTTIVKGGEKYLFVDVAWPR